MWFVHKGKDLKLCKVLFTGKRVHKRTMQTYVVILVVQNRLCYTGPIKSVAQYI